METHAVPKFQIWTEMAPNRAVAGPVQHGSDFGNPIISQILGGCIFGLMRAKVFAQMLVLIVDSVSIDFLIICGSRAGTQCWCFYAYLRLVGGRLWRTKSGKAKITGKTNIASPQQEF